MAAVMTLSLFVTACGSSAGADKNANRVAAAVAQDDNKNDTSVSTDVAADESGLFSKRDLDSAYDAAECDNIKLADEGCTTDSEHVTLEKDGERSIVTITGEGEYLVSGALSDGMIVVDVDKTEKVRLVFNGVDINCASSAAVYVKKADKVFVTLADGTQNLLANGGTFKAVDDNNIDAVIFSKDDLTLNGTGALEVRSPSGHGIVSKNDLVVADGEYKITASSHGMTGKDSVAIADGKFDITAGKDAIKSENNDDDTMGKVHILGGSYRLDAGSDGINALNEINITGGKVVVEQSNEGLEARVVSISGGETDITASDDGINATDKRASVKKETQDKKDFGGGMGDTEPDACIHISGGTVRVDAEGDGLDSNGYIKVSGGETYVTGPSHGGDAALDYGIDATVSGGIVVAAGQSGMAQNFGQESTQGAILVNSQTQNAAGSDIVLLDSDGSEILAWTMEKSYNSVTISCPEIRDGAAYTVRMGDTSTEILMEGLIYGQGFSFGGHGGGRPAGERPEGMPEPPDVKNGEMPGGKMRDRKIPDDKMPDSKMPDGKMSDETITDEGTPEMKTPDSETTEGAEGI